MRLANRRRHHLGQQHRPRQDLAPHFLPARSLRRTLRTADTGPAVLYIAARRLEQGRIAGLASVCGITTGTLVHVLAAALGLSALLASSALAFAVVKYVGAGYLIYIGTRRILSRTEAPATGGVFIGLGVTAAFAGN